MSVTTFYTTAEQEAELNDMYKKEVIVKQKELDDERRRTKKIHKYNATAYIHEKDRVFFICEKGVLWKDENGNKMPTTQQEGGRKYIIADVQRYKSFAENNKEFYVKFHVTGKYGPTVGYIGINENIYPFTLVSKDFSEELLLDDEDKYDLICG